MHNVAEGLQHGHTLAKRDPGKRFDHLWERATDPTWLMHAGEEIRANTGSMTAGIDSTRATDLDPTGIERLSARLKTGTYRPKPVRRVYIAKRNGRRRPLGMPTLEDRIGQQALRMLLEPIFEADFYACAHGFRRNRSTQTALRDGAAVFQRTTWAIEGDLTGCFDHIPHGTLMNAVEPRMAEGKVLRWLPRCLAAGYLEPWQDHRTCSGTPQGGVVSPLLGHIFLHQLDASMMKHLQATNTQTTREENARRNPEYRRITRKSRRRRGRRGQAQGTARDERIRALTGLERQQRTPPCSAQAKRHPSQVGYVRYADDVVMLVQGKKVAAQAVEEAIGKTRQERGLALSEEKTQLTHWRDRVNCLGSHLHGKPTLKGTRIRPLCSLPHRKLPGIKEALRGVGGDHHIPAVDAITQMSALLRGWCHDDR
jgi:group II intron reverse transcriptase/maturase